MNTDEEQIIERSIPAPAADPRSDELPSPPFRITVELPVFLTITCAFMSDATLGNVILYRTCLHSLNHTKEECLIFLSLDKTNENHELEREVQKYATLVITVRGVLEAVTPAILTLFMAVWSDRHGRKPIIVWPLFGAVISSMLQVVYCMWDDLNPWWIIVTSLPYSFTGGIIVMFTGAFCYISDISSENSRSLRMTIVAAAVSLGTIVGGSISSYILEAVGYVYMLLIVATLQVIAYVYTNLWVQESIRGAVTVSHSLV